ncbi:MAG: MFS transporter, partial [Acetobacterales bacterium]
MLAGVWLLYFSFGLHGFSLAPLVVPVTRDLGMSYGDMGWVLGAWQLVYIGSAVPCGVLLDRLGPRKALLIGAALIAASGVCRSLSDDFLSLFLAVALFGLGGPIVSAGAPKVVSLWFKGPSRGMAMGIYVTGPAVGGILVLASTNAVLMPLFDGDWRWVLRLWAALAVVAGVVWFLLTMHPAAQAMERELAAAKKRPQLEVLAGLLRLPPIQLVMVMSVGIFMFNHGLNNWLPELLRAGGMSAAGAGIWSAVPTAVGIAGSLLIPRYATPERRFMVLGLL